MTIGLCGDLKFGRTVHSLIHALVRYPGIKFVLISPEELRLPDYVRHDVLDKMNIPYKEVVRLEDGLPELDILYMTRVQKERFFNEEDYVRMKDFYILDKKRKWNLLLKICTFFIHFHVLTRFLLKLMMTHVLHISVRYSMVYMSVWH